MIELTVGNLLQSPAKALVNTVNTVGVMGKGIALQFKEAYPHNFKVYRKACKEASLKTGQLLIVEDIDLTGERTIINFPTKKHWKEKSKLSYVADGLDALREALISRNIESVAIPPLGCGNGGLDWASVSQLIEEKLGDLPTIIYLYEPNEQISAQLRETAPKKEIELNPARAMILQALYRNEDEGEPISLFVATKLAFFLQKLGGPFECLKFERSFYGPYATGMGHFIRMFNGSYLNGMEQMTARPFDHLPLNYNRQETLANFINEKLSAEHRTILTNLEKLLDGWKSAYAPVILNVNKNRSFSAPPRPRKGSKERFSFDKVVSPSGCRGENDYIANCCLRPRNPGHRRFYQARES